MDTLVWAGLRTLRRERGQDMAEYALLIAFVAIIAMVAISYIGNTIGDTLYNGFSANLMSVLH